MDQERGTTSAGAEGAVAPIAGRDDRPTPTSAVKTLKSIMYGNNRRGPHEAAAWLIGTYFGGSVERYRSQEGDLPSLQEIADHPDLPWEKPTIHAWLNVYEFCDRAGRSDWPLDFTHMKQILPLRSTERQVALLDEAVRRCWTTRELKEAVRKEMPPRRTGRKPDLNCERTMKLMDRALDVDERLAGLNRVTADRRKLGKLKQQVRRLEDFLAELKLELDA